MWKACSHTFFLLVVVSQAGAATLWAREHGVPVPEMVFVHGGTFETGGDPNKDVSGREYVLRDFWIGRTEVTFGQFDSFCEETGYYEERFSKGIVSPVHDGERRGIWKATQPEGSAPDAEPPEHPLRNYPAIEVCWLDACAFCLWLSEKTGIGFRLPTQAEWGYACTARGTQPAVESDRLGEVAWFAESANRRDGRTQIRPVAAKMANSLGLYDMLGNVWEWCADWYDVEYYAKSPMNDPEGPATGEERVYRGGGWFNCARGCRSATRSASQTENRNLALGFRVAVAAE